MIAIGLLAGGVFGIAGTSASAAPVAVAASSPAVLHPADVSQAAGAVQAKGVVLIDTVLRYAGARGAGTGIVLTSSGQIMTNYHVVEGATSITVTVASDGTTYRATVVGHDQTRDGALVQDVVPDGPAAQAGLAAGDLITAVGSRSITTVDELSDLLETHDVGDRIAVHWSDSSGAVHDATVTLAANPIA